MPSVPSQRPEIECERDPEAADDASFPNRQFPNGVGMGHVNREMGPLQSESVTKNRMLEVKTAVPLSPVQFHLNVPRHARNVVICFCDAPVGTSRDQ